MFRTAVPVVLVTLVISACGAGMGQSRETRLKEAIFLFNEAVRWGRVQQALARVDPESRAQFIETHREFGQDIQITDYEIVSTTLVEDIKAQVGVQITWYRLTDMVVNTTVLLQHWEEREREWLMIAEEYRSGAAF